MMRFEKQDIIDFVYENVDLQVHILSHYTTIDEAYKKYLLDRGVQLSDINKHLSLAGSKFNPLFAQNPLELLERIQNVPEKDFHEEIKFNTGKTKDFVIHYNHEDFVDGIGTDNLIEISKLNSEELESLELVSRSETRINTIQRKAFSTWQLNIVFDKSKENKVIIKTIFPGTYAPPFPNEGQLKEEYTLSSEFWNNHVFLT